MGGEVLTRYGNRSIAVVVNQRVVLKYCTKLNTMTIRAIV
jgi:hypothetical protein